jgi:hypothetical protein
MATGLDFTTLARVRDALRFDDDDVERDAVISRLITSVSARMEGEMRRYALQDEHTETIPMWPPSRIVQLQGFPVLDTPEPILQASNQRDFVAYPTDLTRGTDYVLENETGRVRFITTLRGIVDPFTGRVLGPTYIKAVYTGGLATTVAAFQSAFPELAEAAELQTAYLYKRRLTSPGGNLVVGPNSTNFEKAYDWLPSVERTLHFYKRRSVY